VWGYGLNSFGSRWRLIAVAFKNGDEPSVYIKCEEFLEQLSDYWLLTNDSAPRNLLQENQFRYCNIPFCRSGEGSQRDIVEATIEWFIWNQTTCVAIVVFWQKNALATRCGLQNSKLNRILDVTPKLFRRKWNLLFPSSGGWSTIAVTL
jgi:hypothetical protein